MCDLEEETANVQLNKAYTGMSVESDRNDQEQLASNQKTLKMTEEAKKDIEQLR